MKHDISINNSLTIPDAELEITTSRAGGPGGQHVNKADTRITVRWNIKNTNVLTEEQKDRVLHTLHERITEDGDLIVNSSISRSQHNNKQDALKRLAQIVRKALHVPKKRMVTKVPKQVQELRLQHKAQHSKIKSMRRTKYHDE